MIENLDSPLKNEMSLGRWLFNPFIKVAGSKALVIGIIILLITSFVGYLSNTHFDGLLDVHTGSAAPIWVFFAESFIDWFSIVLFLFLSALIISKSQWRVIDLLGTQALARWPMLISALVMLPEANRRFMAELLAKTSQNQPLEISFNSPDAIIFLAAAIVSFLMIIWMVTLMYKSYSVSCNVKGPKAIVVFIISLILGEIISKTLIVMILKGVSQG